MQAQLKKLDNGTVFVAEPLAGVQSGSFRMMVPAGAAPLGRSHCGASNLISDWIFRGAGKRDSRQLSDALDTLGLHRSSAVGSQFLSLGAALEASNLDEAIDLYADIVLEPKLTDEQFEYAKTLAIESVKALDDNPRGKVMLLLREAFYPEPYGTNTTGDIDALQKLDADKTRELIRQYFCPSEMIVTTAGKYDFEKIADQLQKRLSGSPKTQCPVIETKTNRGGYQHFGNDGAQVHIGLMTDAVTVQDRDYYNAHAAVMVLSGGMSARLFVEVREKRGLCYAVGARYHSLKDYAGVMCYAGTTPDKAQETADVIRGEFARLAEGITEDEMQRAKVGLKSDLILASESSSSRAGAIGSDYYTLGRVRTLDEIKQKIDAITVDSVLAYLKKHPFKDFTAVTIGPKEIKI